MGVIAYGFDEPAAPRKNTLSVFAFMMIDVTKVEIEFALHMIEQNIKRQEDYLSE